MHGGKIGATALSDGLNARNEGKGKDRNQE